MRMTALRARDIAATSTSRRKVDQALHAAVRAWTRQAVQELGGLLQYEPNLDAYGNTPRVVWRPVVPRAQWASADAVRIGQSLHWVRQQAGDLEEAAYWAAAHPATEEGHHDDEDEEEEAFWYPRQIADLWAGTADECNRRLLDLGAAGEGPTRRRPDVC